MALVGGAIGAFIIALGVIQNIEAIIPPLARLLQQNLNNVFPNQLPDPSTLLDMQRKGYITDKRFRDAFQKLGFDTEWQDLLKNITERFPSIDEYIKLFHRGILTWEHLNELATRHGFSNASLQRLLAASYVLPPVHDLIRFAVREVYSPEIRNKFKMDEGFPEAFSQEAIKQGLSKEYAQNYWAAHWDLPAARQGFEMLHRGVIDEDTLNMLLKALDVMPFWRDKLTAIAYNPLTRVDVRRMHKLGVLDNDQVTKAYKDLGYNQENAEKMTEFTIKYNNSEVDSVTLSQIKNAYIDGIIPLDETIKWFKEIDLSEKEVRFHSNQAIFQKTLHEVNLKKKAYIDRYKIGDLTIEEVEQELYKDGLPANYVKQVVEEIVIDKASRLKVPSLTDAKDWLSKGIINDVDFNNILKKLGYSDTNIVRYLTEFTIDNDTSRKTYMKKDTYIRWYKKGIMNYKDFYEVMTEQGISEEDVNYILAEIQGEEDETKKGT